MDPDPEFAKLVRQLRYHMKKIGSLHVQVVSKQYYDRPRVRIVQIVSKSSEFTPEQAKFWDLIQKNTGTICYGEYGSREFLPLWSKKSIREVIVALKKQGKRKKQSYTLDFQRELDDILDQALKRTRN